MTELLSEFQAGGVVLLAMLGFAVLCTLVPADREGGRPHG